MEQECMTQLTPSTSHDQGRVQTRRLSTTPEQLPMKKIFKCAKCNHPPFQTKNGLAQHISIYDICGKTMSVHHLPDHKDSHSLRDRYICQEKVASTGKACQKSYKQKSGIVRHLKNVHKGKSFLSARLKIIDRKDLQYETKDNYAWKDQKKDLLADEVARLVETYVEEVYVE